MHFTKYAKNHSIYIPILLVEIILLYMILSPTQAECLTRWPAIQPPLDERLFWEVFFRFVRPQYSRLSKLKGSNYQLLASVMFLKNLHIAFLFTTADFRAVLGHHVHLLSHQPRDQHTWVTKNHAGLLIETTPWTRICLNPLTAGAAYIRVFIFY